MRAVALACAAVIVAVSTAMATPGEDLAQARKAFREGQFNIALEKYNALLYPDLRLAGTEDLVEAYINLGVCRLETGDDEGAKREFGRALELDPTKQLDTLVITNKKAIELYDDTKADIRTRKERESAKQREALEKERLRKLRASLIGYRDNPYFLNFAPFGVGHLWYGKTFKGIALGTAQLATLSTSLGIWFTLVAKYGIRSDKVPLDDAQRVLTMQRIEVGAGVAFIGFYIWSVIDMHRHYEPQTRTKIDESLLPPELREIEKKPAAKPKQTSLLERMFVAPILTPDGAGIGLGWEMK
jgi:tetratricopeptide (TPR) repeat protein